MSGQRAAANCDAVEITCHAKGPVIRAEACTDDVYSALDIALDKLFERLRRASDRRRVSRTGRRVPESVAQATGLVSEAGGAGDWSRLFDQAADPDGGRRLRRGRGVAHRGAGEGPRQRPDDAGGRAQPDGARRPRLLPLPRLGHGAAERRLPPSGLVLRRDPPQGRRRRCSGQEQEARRAGPGRDHRGRSATGRADRTTACNDARHGRFGGGGRPTSRCAPVGDERGPPGSAQRAEPIRVLVADDHVLFRRGLEMVLRRRTGSRSSARPATAWRRCGVPRSCCPTSSSWMSGCPRRRGSRPAWPSRSRCRPAGSSC